MPDISAKAVAALRARTGVSMMKCKEALEEAGGDEEKAIEILRKKGMDQAVKKAGREQREGMVFIQASKGKAGLVLLQCETDFVARDENFQALGKVLATTLHDKGEEAAKKVADEKIPELVQKLGENISIGEEHLIEDSVIGTYVHSNGKIGVVIGTDKSDPQVAKDVAMHAAAMNPQYVSPEDVPADVIVKEKEIWKDQMKDSGKPANIVEKIMMGKEKKFREENALMKQEFVKEPGKTVEQYLNGAKVLHYCRVSIS